MCVSWVRDVKDGWLICSGEIRKRSVDKRIGKRYVKVRWCFRWVEIVFRKGIKLSVWIEWVFRNRVKLFGNERKYDWKF